jgi:hypothetical protein
MISSLEGDGKRVSSFRADVTGVFTAPLRAGTRCISILMHLSLSLSLSWRGWLSAEPSGRRGAAIRPGRGRRVGFPRALNGQRLASRLGGVVCVALGVLSLGSGSAVAAGGFALPDGRAWEMVSPVDKHGAAVEGLGSSILDAGLVQAAEGGSAIAYLANGSIVEGAVGNQAPSLSQVLSRRGVGGWSSQDIATPHESTVDIGGGRGEYDLFSPDLSVGLVGPKGETPLPPLEKGAEQTLYLRDDESGSYLPLVTAASVRPGSKIGGGLAFEGASSDLSHVVFLSPEALTESAEAVRGILGEPFRSFLYEWAGGRLQLVSLLPPNAEGTGPPPSPALAAAYIGFQSSLVSHAVSSDGSRVVWEATFAEAAYRHLYVRDVARGVSVQVDVVQPGAEGGQSEPVFQTASADGSLVFFTDSARLTVGSHASADGTYGVAEPDLYVFDVSSGVLRDLTSEGEGAPGEAAFVEGAVLGASEDGSYVYFAARGVLAEHAVSGANNLYVDHESGGVWEKPRFIADLTTSDIEGGLSAGERGVFAATGPAQNLVSRVSPDGRFVTFMSDASLTGYDNRDAVTGVPDEEVYLYEADTGRLVCASCDPSGARPVGVLDWEHVTGSTPLVDPDRTWNEATLAGNTPAWSWGGHSDSRTDYQSRFLGDSGRLFFNSPDGLVPGDVNGKEDVYEFEPAGVGGCVAGVTSASVVYSAADDGCVGLVSSGTSGDESAFMDASASGGDVFFLTSAQLVPQDVDGAFDVYDAHECTSVSPCTSPAVVSPPCSTAEGCRASGSGPVFGSPASESFAGAGNAPPPAVVPAAPRGLSRAQKLARALKACRKKPRGRRRVVCEAGARRAYVATTRRARGASSARTGR